ncbi:MAG: YigZ family protein [Daejeonella sp.]|nr:YigZ family protein [Daejeonella sp.]
MLSYDVTNTLVIVVRYFGGTLLGVPGLINAYKSATIEALNASEIISKTLNDVYKLDFDYQKMDAVMKVLKEENLPVSNQSFDNICSLETEIRKSIVNNVMNKITNVIGLRATYLRTV